MSSRMIARRRFHRTIFLAAGVYNIAWGLYSAFDPQWLFRLTNMPLQNHPAIFSGLGMVIGLYGILYFEVARAPERGAPGSGRAYRQDAGDGWRGAIDLERPMARLLCCIVHHERLHLVDSIRALPLRCASSIRWNQGERRSDSERPRIEL